MRGFKSVFLIIVTLLLTGMGANGNRPVAPSEIDKLTQKKAPDFLLQDLQGKKVSLASLKGKVVIVNFWATWCPSCIAEMPSLNTLYHEMKADGLEVVAISLDRSVSDVKKFVEKKVFDYDIVMDEKRSVANQYKVFSLPTTFLINREGIIVEKFFGEYDWTDKEVKRKIEQLVRQ